MRGPRSVGCTPSAFSKYSDHPNQAIFPSRPCDGEVSVWPRDKSKANHITWDSGVGSNSLHRFT